MPNLSWNFLTFLTGSGETPSDDRVGRLVVGGAVTDAAGLRRAARRVGLGVEVENDATAAQVGESDGVAVLVGELEVGGRSPARSSSGRLVVR